MKVAIVIFLVSGCVNCQAYWWPPSSSAQPAIHAENAATASARLWRPVPYGYFRSYSFHPYFMHSPAAVAPVAPFFNPFAKLSGEFLSARPSPVPPPSYRFPPATIAPPQKPAEPKPSQTLYDIFLQSLSATATSILARPVDASSTSISSTPVVPITTTASSTTTSSPSSTTSTTSTTTSTTSTTELPITSTTIESNAIDQNTIPISTRRLDMQQERQANQFNQFNPADAFIQQYLASVLSSPQMHLVPCVCPYSLGVPTLTAPMPEYGPPSGRSEDVVDVDNDDSTEGVIDEQSTGNKID